MADDTKDRTLWCGNLSEDVSEELLYELFIQSGPVEQVKIPVNDGKKKPFAFITFRHSESVPYSMELMSDVRLFGQYLRLQFRSGSIHEQQKRGDYNQQQQTPPHMMQNMQPMSLMGPMPMMQPAGFNMGAFNPLCPPMGTVLQATNFHRSNSAPDFGHVNNQGQFAGPLMDQPHGRGGHGARGQYSRDFSPNDRQESSNRGYSRDRNHDRKRSYDDRSKGSPVDDSYPRRDHRSGDVHRDRSREDRRGREQDRRDDRREIDHRRESGRRAGDSGSVGRSTGRDLDIDPQARASQNFRRQMASPPWQRSKPPWQQ